jgi:glycosyltransferase involved in cell wall biosynthesis
VPRICVIRQGYFPLDTRVRREVNSLVDAGHEVDVICLTRRGEARYERQGRLAIYRLPLRHRRQGAVVQLLEHFTFLVMAAFLSGVLHAMRRYDLVQTNTIPDSVVFAALVPRLLGARVLIDLHECMPEFFATRLGVRVGHPGVRAMKLVEQASIRFAHGAITCTEQMREAFASRGAPRAKIVVVLNSAEESIFDPERYPPRPREPHRFDLVCHGSIEERYGLDTIVRAVHLLRNEVEPLRLKICGEGSYEAELRRLVSDLALEDRVEFTGGLLPLDELLSVISAADVGVVAMKRDAFRDLTHTNKMFDLIAMRRPAIISRTRSVLAYFDEGCFLFFTSGDEQDLARAIRELYVDPKLGERLVERATAVSEPYRWSRQREIYLSVVERLLDRA